MRLIFVVLCDYVKFFNNENFPICGSSPNNKLLQKQGEGIGLGTNLISGLFHKQCGGGYRLQYTYLSNLVARTVVLHCRGMAWFLNGRYIKSA